MDRFQLQAAVARQHCQRRLIPPVKGTPPPPLETDTRCCKKYKIRNFGLFSFYPGKFGRHSKVKAAAGRRSGGSLGVFGGVGGVCGGGARGTKNGWAAFLRACQAAA